MNEKRTYPRGECRECARTLLIVCASKGLCSTCYRRATSVYVRRNTVAEIRKAKRAAEVRRIQNYLILDKRPADGRCVECRATMNSYSQSRICCSCRRALRRLLPIIATMD